MKNSKLSTYLSTFNKDDWMRFSHFVESPYFNAKQELIQFFDILFSFYQNGQLSDLTKEKVLQKLKPLVTCDDKKLGYLMSDLTKLVERYFTIEKSRQQDTTEDANLLGALIDRKLFKSFQQHFRKITKELEVTRLKNANFYLKQFLIYEKAVRLQEVRQVRDNSQYQELTADYLDRFYMARKLQHSCSLLNNQHILSDTVSINFLKEVMEYLQQNPPQDLDCLKAYHLAVKMLSDETQIVHYRQLKDFISQKEITLTPDDGRFIHFSLINYAARKIREGNRDFLEEALNISLRLVENEEYYEGGFISPWIFKNIINLSLSVKLRSHEWVEAFIHDYHKKLPIDFQDNALHYNLAFLYWSQKRYDEAIFHLNQTQFTDISYNLGSKVILMQIYYEINEEEPLLSLIASFTLFLKRNKKISKSQKLPYLNFCKLLNKIMRRKEKQLPAIKEQIQQTKVLTARSWLMGVIQDWETSVNG